MVLDRSRTVAQVSVAASEPIGIEVGAATLQQEIAAGVNVEAALVGLAHLEPRSATTTELIARLETSASPRIRAAVNKAKSIVATP